MKFRSIEGNVSITLINPSRGNYGKTKYDIRIFKNVKGKYLKTIIPGYETHTLKYKAETEAASMITGMALEYIEDDRKEFQDVYLKLSEVLSLEEIKDINECSNEA